MNTIENERVFCSLCRLSQFKWNTYVNPICNHAYCGVCVAQKYVADNDKIKCFKYTCHYSILTDDMDQFFLEANMRLMEDQTTYKQGPILEKKQSNKQETSNQRPTDEQIQQLYKQDVSDEFDAHPYKHIQAHKEQEVKMLPKPHRQNADKIQSEELEPVPKSWNPGPSLQGIYSNGFYDHQYLAKTPINEPKASTKIRFDETEGFCANCLMEFEESYKYKILLTNTCRGVAHSICLNCTKSQEFRKRYRDFCDICQRWDR